MALFTSILAFAGSATNALATAAAPNARRDFSTSGSGALDGLRAAAEATTNKQRIGAAVRTQARGCPCTQNCRACCYVTRRGDLSIVPVWREEKGAAIGQQLWHQMIGLQIMS